MMKSNTSHTKSFSPKKILVTGATGFVGSHIVEELISKNHEIIATVLEFKPFIFVHVFRLQGLLLLIYRAGVQYLF